MSRSELVQGYLDGQLSRRVFIRRLVATGVTAAAAISYAGLLEAAPAGAVATDFYLVISDFAFNNGNPVPLAQGQGVEFANHGDVAPPEGAEVAHFLVPTAQLWDDVVHTCGHQRLFCGEPCVDRWLVDTGNDRGYVMDLPTLWRLAEGWYAGRLDRGYVRLEPEAAHAYFREVGLDGGFWGL